MSQEEFQSILERQHSSGLTIKDFCENESYTVSSFHYWKSKYGLTRPYHPQRPVDTGFVPINLTPGVQHSSMTTGPTNQIEIEYPNGIKIRLNHFSDLQSASLFLSQTLRTHVLPE